MSTLKIAKKGSRKSAYWWSKELRGLREECVRWRRRWIRCKKKRRETEELRISEEEYRKAKKNLKAEIDKAKERAWKELVETVDMDP